MEHKPIPGVGTHALLPAIDHVAPHETTLPLSHTCKSLAADDRGMGSPCR